MPSAICYVVPFVLYLVLTQIPPRFPDRYALMYSVVVAVVGLVTIGLLRGRQIIRPHAKVAPGVLVGLVGIALWIVLASLRLEQAMAAYLPGWLRPPDRAGYQPFEQLSQSWALWGFLAARLVGLVILVPVVEEVFWRGFLLRWLISPDWQQVELGRFTIASLVGTTVGFTLAHPEWFAAAVYCALLNGLIYWKRDLFNCIVAHAVSNLVLAVYVLTSGNWWLW